MIELFIPGVPSNANGRGSSWAKNRERAAFRALTRQIASERAWPEWEVVRLSAWHVSPLTRRRDPLGLAERLKPIADGLVDAGLLVDDDEKHLIVELLPSVKGAVRGIGLRLEGVR